LAASPRAATTPKETLSPTSYPDREEDTGAEIDRQSAMGVGLVDAARLRRSSRLDLLAPIGYTRWQTIKERPVAKVACLTLDLEPDLRAPDKRVRLLEDDAKLDWLLTLLKREGVPLTSFTVMSMTERYGDRLQALARAADIEFAVHSYSHDRAQPASDYEVERSWDAFGNLFNAPPRGYRAPNCLIDHAGIARLARRGFQYDSSIVPSVRFDEYGYNNLSYGRTPFRFEVDGRDIIEFPVACLAGVRVPLIFSYAKVFGVASYRLATAVLPLPDVAVTFFHPYDLYAGEIAGNIPGWKRYAHLRNADRAPLLLERLIAMFKWQGYRFTKIADLVPELQGDASLPVVDVSQNQHTA
jgi:peptidoglycan/xylan/chitin deacetylase (PgdA/CDA1 family)